MNKKALITGLNGFVGPYLKKELEAHEYEVFGFDRENVNNFEKVFTGDIRDRDFLENVMQKVVPDEIYHLAGFSSVKKSFEFPELAMDINVNGTKNLLNAVRKFCAEAKILIVSSSDVYGEPLKLPVNENEPLKETSPYSKSRIEQEKLVNEFKDLHIVISRSFNHTGPGQIETFVLPDFAKQTAEAQKGLRNPVIYTGDLDIVRDFSDVRDIVRAYRLLLGQGKRGNVYNVGSGRGYRLKDLLNILIDYSKIDIQIIQNSDKLRPVEIMEMIADISKLKERIDWIPDHSMEDTLKDLLDYFQNLNKI